MIVLACAAVLCLGAWANSRKAKPLIAAVACLLLAAGCYVLDLAVVTPREIIKQNVYDLTSAFQRQDVPKTLSYFSPQAKERVVVENIIKLVHIEGLRITDLSVKFKAANSLAISHFRANATLSVNLPGHSGSLGHQTSRWELDWQREAGEWKIVRVHRLHPINGEELDFLSSKH